MRKFLSVFCLAIGIETILMIPLKMPLALAIFTTIMLLIGMEFYDK